MRIEKGTGYARKVTAAKIVSNRESESRAARSFDKERESFDRFLDREKRRLR